MNIYELSYQSDFSLSAWQSRQAVYIARRHQKWVRLFASLGAVSPYNFSCTINGLPDKKLKHYSM